MNTLILVLVFAAAYWRLRNLFYNWLTLKYKYRLYALRDKTRRYAIEKKINQHDRFFDYLDTTICVSINSLSFLNIVTVVILFNRHKDQSDIIEISEMIGSATEKNKYAKELYDEYNSILNGFILSKHYMIKYLIFFMFNFVFQILKIKLKFNTFKRNAINSLSVYPETSTAGQFYKLT